MRNRLHPDMILIMIHVNGKAVWIDRPPETPLLYFLRNDVGLNGPKFGCGLGQCGSCTVLVDNLAVRSCITSLGDVEGSDIRTLEGLGTEDRPHPLQKAFIDLQAMQCGYCASGMILSAAALLADNPDPSDAEIRSALSGNLCRCGTHGRILAAVRQAAEGDKI